MVKGQGKVMEKSGNFEMENECQPWIIYIQTSTVQINLSGVVCILGVNYLSLYTSYIYAKKNLQLLGKFLNQYHAKCMRFSKMQLVSHCYTAVLYEPISKLYIYKNSAVYLSDCRATFFARYRN